MHQGAGRLVGGDDLGVLVEGDHRVRRALQDALVVVLHVEHVVEQPGILQAHRDLRREGLQPCLVLGGEARGIALVENLGRADVAALFVEDRLAQDRSGDEAGFAVGIGVEARIRIGIEDMLGDAAGEHRADDAAIRRQPDLVDQVALGEQREQLVGLAVVDEQARPFGVQQLGGGPHDPRDENLELELTGEIIAHLEDKLLLAQRFEHVLEASEDVGIFVG